MLGSTLLNSFLNMESLSNSATVIWMNNHLLITHIGFNILGGLGLISIGFLDTKLGARSEEMRNNSLHNPVTVELLEKIRDIHAKQSK